MIRYALALDLVDDPVLIEEYETMHQDVWPEIQASITGAGILAMEIYRFGNRLFMVMEVGDDFSFDRKNTMDAENEKVQEWEKLMWKYQQAVPGARPGEKWVMMNKIFELNS
ncbi:L-rhamnose mutarotase [Pedobacter sp. GR22-6]|uniref:L-rhamnose mutarotase n=1 Tax=Pedobacter sp. GR22-6 TaxID=3127957 RepID=UPI00307D8B2D